MPSTDKAVIKKHRDAWYEKNKDKQIRRQLDRRRELKDWLFDYKRNQSCRHCGMSFHDRPECCDFHHTDPHLKEGSVARMVTWSIKKAKDELDKCIPLCANCHRTVHKNQNEIGVRSKKIERIYI